MISLLKEITLNESVIIYLSDLNFKFSAQECDNNNKNLLFFNIMRLAN